MLVGAALVPAVAAALVAPGAPARPLQSGAAIPVIPVVRIVAPPAAAAVRTATCAAHRSRGAGKTERKVQPVACEQPPRSRVLVPGLAHPSAKSTAPLLGG